MVTSTAKGLRIGAWKIDSALGQMTRGDDCVRLEPRTLRLLLCLADRAGRVVSAEELLEQVWPGVVVSSDSVYQAIASLRRLLGDDPKQSSYIATVPRQGYRMVAEIGTWMEPDAPVYPTQVTSRRLRFVLAAGTCALLLLAAGFWWRTGSANSSPALPTNQVIAQKSIAVLPFLDLTEQMGEEVFADGMAEELISRFSKLPGLKVPPLSATFAFQGKHLPVNELARQLGVNYILGGSIRKSGNTMRVTVRLLRANDGYIIWSESYDRPANDVLRLQDDIANEVTKALKATVA